MFGIFNKKEPEGPAFEHLILARLNARVQPIDRGDYFEDPLDEILKSKEIGEVTGGGTQLADEPDGIEFVDVEIYAKKHVGRGQIHHYIHIGEFGRAKWLIAFD